MSSLQRSNTILRLLVLLSASVAVTLPIYLFGITNGNDLPQHYQFAMTFERSLEAGELYPSWSSESNNGYGDIGIRFYPPFAYYVMVGAKAVSGNWYDASVITFALWFFVGGIGTYFLAREWLSPNASLVAGLLFLVMPYHTNQIYNAFLYAEFAATSILPFCFLFAYRVSRNGSLFDVAGLAASYSILILTHLPLTVIGSISLLIFSLASLRRETAVSSLSKHAGSVALSLVATSFYWLRMVSELSLVNHAHAELAERAYDFRINFLLSYLNTPISDYLDRSLFFSDIMLIATLAIAVAGGLPFALRNAERKLLPLWALLATSVFFATPLSLPIWESLEFLSRVQFPWRWLAVISIVAAVLAASGMDAVVGYFHNEKRPIGLMVAGIAAMVVSFTVAQVIRPAVHVSRPQFEDRIAKLQNAKSCECFWPVTAGSEALSVKAVSLPAGRDAELFSYSPVRREYSVNAGEAGEMRLPLFYYPLWNAYVNGEPRAPGMDSTGALTVDLPPEPSNVVVRFEEPQPYRFADIISVIGWLALFGIGFFGLTRRLNGKPQGGAEGLS